MEPASVDKGIPVIFMDRYSCRNIVVSVNSADTKVPYDSWWLGGQAGMNRAVLQESTIKKSESPRAQSECWQGNE
jgi:hypothetical protein